MLPVIRHKRTHPALTPARVSYWIYPPWRDERLSWPRWSVTYRDRLPTHSRSPIQVLTQQCTAGGWTCSLLITSPTPTFSLNPSQSVGVSLAIWDHTVLPATRHKWTHPGLTPAVQADTRFAYPGGVEGWVDLSDRLWLPTHRRSPIQVLTRQCTAGSWTRDLLIRRPKLTMRDLFSYFHHEGC